MKSFVLLLVSLIAFASGLPVSEDLEQNEYPQIVESNNDGLMVPLDEDNRNPSDNKYVLYTRENPTTGQDLIINNVDSVELSNFNPEKPIVLIIHGFMVYQMRTMSPNIRDSVLQMEDANVIIVDWLLVALQDYVVAAGATPSVGRAIGQFIAFLHEVTGAPYENMHLVGLGLGAHAAGNAGREVMGKVARITGLDPSGPLWNFNPYRLDKEDAVLVEGIHTDGGVSGLGIGSPLGDIDFFPNGGISQPGCVTSYCEHNRSWQFFDATLKYNHLIGNQCSTLVQVSLNTCRGTPLNMGNNILTKTGSGLYRVNTGRRYPF